MKITPNSEVVAWKNETHLYHEFLMPLEHPNILRFIIASKMPGDSRWALVTEYHPLGSLTDLLKGRVISLEEAEKIMVSMLTGITFLHDCDGKPSIAHRDFKTTNVLIKSDMTCCIADFGLATAFEPDEKIGDKHGQVSLLVLSLNRQTETAVGLKIGIVNADAVALYFFVPNCQNVSDSSRSSGFVFALTNKINEAWLGGLLPGRNGRIMLICWNFSKTND